MTGLARALTAAAARSPFPPLLAAVAVLPLVAGSGFLTTLMTQAMTMATFALSFNFLLGHAGLLSFGHAVYFGFGSYATVHVLNAVLGHLSSSPLGPLAVALSPLVGASAAAIVALVLGWLTSRRAGTVFAMITLGLGELIHQAALMSPDFFGGEGGVTTNRVLGAAVGGIDWASPAQMYLLATAWCLICWSVVRWLLATPFGALCMALRDNPQRLQALGFVPQHLRYGASLAAAALAGAAGSLSALTLEFATPEAFSASQSASVLIAAYIGGIGHPFGPVLGGLVYTAFSVGVAKISEAWHLYLGALFIATVMALPGGLTSLWSVGLARHPRRWMGPVGAGLLWVAALVTLVELVYRWRLGAGGEPLHLGPLALHADDPSVWVTLMATLALATWSVTRSRSGG